MLTVAVNGSPRKKWNTATLLKKALEGAASEGAKTELFHFYDLDYKGCISCFACKTRGGKSYGKSGQGRADPAFGGIEKADVIFLGSPIYFGTAIGQMRSFMERLSCSSSPIRTLRSHSFPERSERLSSTRWAPARAMKERGFDRHIVLNEGLMKLIFGASETLCSYDTYQFEDYSKVSLLVSIPGRRQGDGQKRFQSTAKTSLRWARGFFREEARIGDTFNLVCA